MGFGDILSGFAQAGHEHQTNLIQMAYRQRDQLADAYSRLMQDDSYPEEARQQFGQAFQDITTSDPFKLPQLIKKYKDMTITVKPPQRPAQQGPEVDQNLSVPWGSPGAPLGMQVPNIPPPVPPKGMMEQPPDRTASLFAPIPFEEQMSRLRQTEKIKDQGALDVAAAKAGEWKRQTDFARDTADGKRHKFVSETRVNPDTGESERREVDLGDIANFAPRMGDLVTLQRAKEDRDNGFFNFRDMQGKDLDIDKMIAVHGPYAVIRNKGAYYEPADQKQSFITFNNQVNAVNPLAPNAPTTVMGTAIMPKTSERPQQIPNDEGGRSIITPTATTTVQTGAPGAPAPVSPPGTVPAPAAVTPPVQAAPVVPPPAKPPVTSLSVTTSTPPATGRTAVPQDETTGKLPLPKGSKIKAIPIEGSMSPGEYNRQAKIVTSIHPALNTLMGDPENPGFKGMDQFADLVESPEASNRLGTAARLVIHEMADTNDGGGGLGASILGTGVSLGGGLIKALENKFGLTAWKASTSGKVIDQAMKDLTPAERQFLDRIIGAYGTVVGLRAVTSGSALQFNTKLMELELPIPGISGAITRRQFYDKIATLAGEPISATKTFSNKIFVDRDYYRQATRRFTALGNGETVVKGTGGKPDLVLRNGQWVPLL